MFPILKDGDTVVAIKNFSFLKIKVDDIVVFQLPTHKKLMIKRVVSVHDGLYKVLGESSFSTDSRDFGTLKKEEILYKVLFKF
jgi:phage repressor protein C with HTH and peptisase S24 domain